MPCLVCLEQLVDKPSSLIGRPACGRFAAGREDVCRCAMSALVLYRSMSRKSVRMPAEISSRLKSKLRHQPTELDLSDWLFEIILTLTDTAYDV